MNNGRVGSPVGERSIRPFWIMFFWAAAVFNFVLGLSGMLAPVPTIDTRIIGLFVFAFGVVYVLVARDPMRFAPVLWAAIIAKLGVVALLAQNVLGTQHHGLAVAVLAINAIFAIGFLGFLFTRPNDG